MAEASERSWIPPALAVLGVALGCALRLDDFASLFLYGDELHGLVLSREGYGTILRSFDPSGSGIALPLLQRLSRDLFGDALWAFRLPALAGGLVGLALVYPMGKDLVGRPAAALATLALALWPLHVYASHFARADSLTLGPALILANGLHRIEADARPGAPWMALAAACAALLPWLQPTAAGFVLAAGVGTLLALGVERRPRRRWLHLAGVAAAAGAGALLLHLPAWQPLVEHVGAGPGPGSPGFGILDVAALLAGSPALAAVWLVGVPAAALFGLRERPGRALIVGCAALLPIAVAAAARPAGGELAWARYLQPALGFQLLLLAWGAVRLGGAPFADARIALRAGLALGILAIALSWWLGPLGRGQRDAGPYANLRPSLVRAAADAPRPGISAFYATLADRGATRIVEAPALTGPDLELYRSAYLQHGLETWLGYTRPSPLELLAPGPYVDLFDPEALRASGAQLLVLHRDVDAELGRRPTPRPLWQATAERLERAWGAPVYADAAVRVWRLSPPAQGLGGAAAPTQARTGR